ncbi:KGGVGR-motif variant AAA ATPase [Candidatus Symbiobacter mobilis]|uniref:Uncharacterized protein n=1 Tax=Candidatus Symbiobacter mobilis CR TaxID=946483 RepID=U5NDH3_9BURK|nr:hypothetical protein [Candidatus Symbiobacter mobilis]AGX88224.1 hypothetical protein Cenrod_2155 [Candidatus Symbiobacter mobilis CR]
MSLQSSVAERLLTWLDVDRLLKQRTALWTQLPAGVHGVDCFADGIEIRHCTEAVQVDDWLASMFGPAYHRAERAIRLRIGAALYPVELVQEAAAAPMIPAMQTYPLWRDMTYLPSVEAMQPTEESIHPQSIGCDACPPSWNVGPDLVSFHSFKGGVGRTTTLMTYVTACMMVPSSTPKKILVVDADLEAPGISFWLDTMNRPTVSFVHLLEALHYPPLGIDATLDFFAEELRKTSLNVAGRQRELFVLPATLELGAIQDMPVTPEHLARNPANPWQLSDRLHALGQRLGVDAVFIDLRAGLSELASPILFDPRVDHFFVSTVAPQSVEGMKEVLQRLHFFNRRLPADQQGDARPTVVLSMLTKTLREGGHYEQALKALGEAYPGDDALTPGVQWLEAEFLSTLMAVSTVREALEVLPQSGRLFASACEWATALYASPTRAQQVPRPDMARLPSSTRLQQAHRLHEVCDAAGFADGHTASAMLAIEPLRNLGKHYAKELPNVLVIGAKGAGKTFTFRQMVRTGTWPGFLEKLGFEAHTIINAAIFPVLWSGNMEDKPDGEIKTAQRRALDVIAGDKHCLLRGTEVYRRIQQAIHTPPATWEEFWDGLIAQQLGVATSGLHDLNDLLITRGHRIVFVVDGIEDVFEDATKECSIDAIQALLRLPNRIGELENRHIGVMIFIRADYVYATVRQNLGQLLQRFQPFRLQWNPENFLQLAFMLCCQAQIFPDDPKSAESLRIEQLKDQLERLWGKKLGREKSKEAHSARWVYAALSDLKGLVQARDLVRFLRFAAELESTQTSSAWPDRILSPESMRKAIPLCSQEKISEAKQEIASLRRWTALMEEHGIRNIRIPFSPAEARLDANLLSALQELGVIYEDMDGNLGEKRLFLPEIYRCGLGFETSMTGRPRTQALLKKNIGSIPL